MMSDNLVVDSASLGVLITNCVQILNLGINGTLMFVRWNAHYLNVHTHDVVTYTETHCHFGGVTFCTVKF
jgi:hypothetical protein